MYQGRVMSRLKQDGARWVADRCLGRLPVREVEQSHRHGIGPAHKERDQGSGSGPSAGSGMMLRGPSGPMLVTEA